MPRTRSVSHFKQHHRKRRSRALLAQGCLGVVILALVFGISYASVQILHGQPVFPVQESTVPPASSDAGQESPDTPPDVPPAQPDTPAVPPEDLSQAWNTAVPAARTLPGEITVSDSRILAVPKNGRLSEEYLRHIMFVGDSLSQGFAIYPPTRGVSTVCAYKSTSPNQVLQNFVGERPDHTRIEMWDDIKTQNPETIYLLYGTNALVGQTDEAFLKYYGDLMDRLRATFPSVPIYVQSITPTLASQGIRQPPLENGHIRSINNVIAKMAVDRGMYYLDAQEALADSEGNLRGDYVGTLDGIHMNPKGYREWTDYILTHTVYSEFNSQFAIEPYC